MNHDYYDDRRWCPGCRQHVPYLLSPHGAWCSSCGDRVRLFSEREAHEFRQGLRAPALRHEIEMEIA